MALTDLLRDVDELSGWDWSACRTRTGDFGWDYQAVVRSYLADAACALDVGTGGGEVYSELARPGDVALDFSLDMLGVARSHLPCPLVAGDKRALPFADGVFDVMTDRHVGCPPVQVLGSLRPGGVYVHQAVGGNVCQNIFDALGWGSNAEFWRRESGDEFWNVARMVHIYERAGCTIERHAEANVPHVFEDEASLAYWLVNAPLPELPDDPVALNALPLETNWHAELLVVRMPQDSALCQRSLASLASPPICTKPRRS